MTHRIRERPGEPVELGDHEGVAAAAGGHRRHGAAMCPDSAGFRYAGVSSQFVPVDPFLVRWPRVESNPGSDQCETVEGTSESGVTDIGRQAGPGANIARSLSGPWPRPPTDDGVVALLDAAERARVVFPGPVGELIQREVHAYLEIGHRFGGDTLIPQIAAQLLAAPAPRSDPAVRRLSPRRSRQR